MPIMTSMPGRTETRRQACPIRDRRPNRFCSRRAGIMWTARIRAAHRWDWRWPKTAPSGWRKTPTPRSCGLRATGPKCAAERKETIMSLDNAAMTVFGDSISGNCLKVKFVADLLGIAHDWVEISVLKGETRTPEFLAMNPAGQVPVVRFADNSVLSQSNAIMLH